MSAGHAKYLSPVGQVVGDLRPQVQDRHIERRPQPGHAAQSSDAISRWWELSAIRQALNDGRWDTVVHAAIEAGASQQDIAAACGLSQPYVSRIASGGSGAAVAGDDRPAARRSCKLAVQAAAQTRHLLLTVYMTGSLAQFAVIDGDPVNAQAIVKRARTALPPNAPPIALVWLDCIEASIVASARNDKALRLLYDAGRKLTAAEPVWPWLNRFDAAKRDTYRSTVYVRLRREPDQWPKPVNPMTAIHPKQAADRMMERATALPRYSTSTTPTEHAPSLEQCSTLLASSGLNASPAQWGTSARDRVPP